MMDLIPKSKIEIPAEMHTSAMPKLNLESMAFWLSIIALFSTIAMAIVRPSSSQWDFINWTLFQCRRVHRRIFVHRARFGYLDDPDIAR